MPELKHDYSLTREIEIKRHLSTLLKEQKRRRGINDLHFLCKHILGYKDLTEEDGFHGDYCRHLSRKRKFKLTLTPRGSLKSSISTIGGSIQDIIKNPNTRGLIASEKFSIATKFLAEIKGHFEKNEVFRDLYGNLVGKDKWTESEIIISTRTHFKASSTITCAGIDVTKVGMHYDWIRVDDPHSDQNTTNQEQIDKVIRWYRLLLSLLDPWGYLYITGTIWHYNDLYRHIITKEREREQKGLKKKYIIFQRDSFEGTSDDLLNDRVTKDKLLWPKRLSAQFLKEQLLEQGPFIFNCQYRLNPIDDENAIFKRSWIKTCTWEDVPTRMEKFTCVDPMRDENGQDYLAIVTCGIDENWKQYILDIRRKKADEYDTIEEMVDVYQKWKPQRMGFEAVAWQLSYLKYLKTLQALKGIRFPISELKNSTRITKPMHIKSMVPYFRSGLIIIPTKDGTIDSVSGNYAILVDELTRFPKTANDDTIDALAYVGKLAKVPGVVSILKKIDPNSFMGVRSKLKKPKNVLGNESVRRNHAIR